MLEINTGNLVQKIIIQGVNNGELMIFANYFKKFRIIQKNTFLIRQNLNKHKVFLYKKRFN